MSADTPQGEVVGYTQERAKARDERPGEIVSREEGGESAGRGRGVCAVRRGPLRREQREKERAERERDSDREREREPRERERERESREREREQTERETERETERASSGSRGGGGVAHRTVK
jgi:hypothetical protein